MSEESNFFNYQCPVTFTDKFLIENFFKTKANGYFIEIGAANGVQDSSAYILEKHFNWNGIAVEANPDFFSELEKNRRCKCVNVALSNTTGKDKFIKSKNKHYSGLEKYITSWHSDKVYNDGFTAIDVETLTIEDLLKANECPVDIDFISIDVEGAELEILEKFPFDKYNVSLFIVEKNVHRINDFLKSNGYIEIVNPHSQAPYELYFSKKPYNS